MPESQKIKHGSSQARPGTRILSPEEAEALGIPTYSRLRDLASAETSLRGYAEGVGKARTTSSPRKAADQEGVCSRRARHRPRHGSGETVSRPAREGCAQRQALGIERSYDIPCMASICPMSRIASCCQWKRVHGGPVVGWGVETTHDRLVIGEDVETTHRSMPQRATAMTVARLRSGCGRDPDRLAWMHPSG
jgi:hypothetical protein